MKNKEDSKITNDEMDLLMSTDNNYDDEQKQENKDENDSSASDEESKETNESETQKSETENEENNEEIPDEEVLDDKEENEENEENQDKKEVKKEKKKSSKPLLFLVLILIGVIIFFLVDHKLNSKSNISKNEKDLIVDYDKTDDDNQIKIDESNTNLDEEDKENLDNNLDDNESLNNEDDLELENNNDLKNSDTQDFINIDTQDENIALNDETNNESNNEMTNNSDEKNTNKQSIEYRYYKLKPNETLFSLSMWYYNKKSKIEEIKRLNNITDVNAISTRKSLKLMPYKNGKMSSYAPKYYKIKKGETLFSVSMKFYNEKRMIEAIKKLNNISNEKVNDISTGTTLLMP